MKKLLFFCLLSPVLFGCSKEDDTTSTTNPNTPTPSNHRCLVKEIKHSYFPYTEKFFYDASDLISRVNRINNDSSITYDLFQYNPDKSLKRKDYNNPTAGIFKQFLYQYNAAGKLIEVAEYSLQNGSPLLMCTNIFVYNAGQIARMNNGNCGGANKQFVLYNYGPNTLIQQFFRDSTALNPMTIREVEFDTKNHPLGETGLNISEYYPSYPMKNNIVRLTMKNQQGQAHPDSYTATHQYNAQGYPTRSIITKLSGIIDTLNYSYQCK